MTVNTLKSFSAASPTVLATIPLALALLLPIWLTEVPALADLPNHLARIHILNNIERAPFAEVFRPDWAILPNLGFDVFMVAATGLGLGYLAAAKLFLSLAAVMTVTGAALLSHKVAGRVTPFALMAAPLFYTGILYLGFLSFIFSIGVMLLMTAGFYDRLTLKPFNLLLLSICAVILFFIHLYGLAALYWALGCFILAERWQGETNNRTCLGRLALLGATVLPAAFLLVASPTAGTASLIESSSPETKLLGTFYFLGGLGHDVVWLYYRGQLLLGAGLLLIALLVWRGGYRLSAPGVILVASGVLIFIALPYRLLSSFNADWRFLLPFFIVCGAALLSARSKDAPAPAAKRLETFALIPVALLTLLQVFIAFERNNAMAGRLEVLREVTATLPRESRVFTFAPRMAQVNMLNPPPILHAVGFLVLEKDVIPPSIFAFEGQQPLAYRKALEPLIQATAEISYVEEPPDWASVTENYSYVLLLKPESPLPPIGPETIEELPPCLEEIASQEPFTLFRIAATGC